MNGQKDRWTDKQNMIRKALLSFLLRWAKFFTAFFIWNIYLTLYTSIYLLFNFFGILIKTSCIWDLRDSLLSWLFNCSCCILCSIIVLHLTHTPESSQICKNIFFSFLIFNHNHAWIQTFFQGGPTIFSAVHFWHISLTMGHHDFIWQISLSNHSSGLFFFWGGRDL